MKSLKVLFSSTMIPTPPSKGAALTDLMIPKKKTTPDMQPANQTLN